MAKGTSGRIGEKGGERAEEEGDGGAKCDVMESSVDAPLQEHSSNRHKWRQRKRK
jgi:hypothetical protein